MASSKLFSLLPWTLLVRRMSGRCIEHSGTRSGRETKCNPVIVFCELGSKSNWDADIAPQVPEKIFRAQSSNSFCICQPWLPKRSRALLPFREECELHSGWIFITCTLFFKQLFYHRNIKTTGPREDSDVGEYQMCFLFLSYDFFLSFFMVDLTHLWIFKGCNNQWRGETGDSVPVIVEMNLLM